MNVTVVSESAITWGDAKNLPITTNTFLFYKEAFNQKQRTHSDLEWRNANETLKTETEKRGKYGTLASEIKHVWQQRIGN